MLAERQRVLLEQLDHWDVVVKIAIYSRGCFEIFQLQSTHWDSMNLDRWCPCHLGIVLLEISAISDKSLIASFPSEKVVFHIASCWSACRSSWDHDEIVHPENAAIISLIIKFNNGFTYGLGWIWVCGSIMPDSICIITQRVELIGVQIEFFLFWGTFCRKMWG